jgi:hypothetical protein
LSGFNAGDNSYRGRTTCLARPCFRCCAAGGVRYSLAARVLLSFQAGEMSERGYI